MRIVSHGSFRAQGFLPFAVVCAILLCAAIPGTASADYVTQGQSSSYSVSANLNLRLLDTSVVSATVAPTPLASGTAPAPYTNQQSLASLSVSQGTFLAGTDTLLNVQTGLLQSTATSNVDGHSGPNTTSATNVIHNLNSGVLTNLLTPTMINIGAATITTNSAVSGNYGALVPTGSMVVEDLVVKLAGVAILDLVGTVTVAPNTVVDVSALGAGVSLVLNEQIPSGNGVTHEQMVTNAIDLRFTNLGVSGIGTLNGQLVIGHTDALQDAVPEPPSAVILGIGSGLCTIVARRFRKTPKKVA
jgi:hypothetical protein